MMNCDYAKALIILTMMLALFPQKGRSANEIFPSGALIIFTREAWGCLAGQEVKEDVTSKLVHEDGNLAHIQEIKNPEDVANRYELYLLFPADPLNQLPGHFVLKFWCIGDQPMKKASFSMDIAALRRAEKSWLFSTKVKGNGFVRAQMLYSRTAEMRHGWFSCSQAGRQPPYRVSFFNAYPLEGELAGMPKQKITGEWQTLELAIDPLFLEGALAVHKCQAFLDLLDREFAVKEDSLIWEYGKVRTEAIRKLIAKSAEKDFHVLIRVDDRTKVLVGADNFVPHMRQKLALRKRDGTLIGAELWLRANP